MAGIQAGLDCIDVEIASLMAVGGMSSATAPMEGPKLEREQQWPCGIDARQHTIASGSCCCSRWEQSCIPPGWCQTESSGWTARSKIENLVSETGVCVWGRGS